MKAKIYFSIVLVILVSLNISAQIKVNTTNGKAIIGSDRTNDDLNNVLSASIFGKGGVNRYGGKLAFGDFGQYTYYGWNAFVGEYGNFDSDRLWLHGKNGIYLTWNRGDNIIGYWDVNQSDRFTFNCDVYTGTIKLTSDSRLKTNVKKISNSMSQLRKLNGVSYNLLKKEDLTTKSSLESAKVNDSIQPSEKEIKDKAYFEALTAKLEANKPKRMGFIAQDLQKVFPELVDKDSAGYFSVDYIGLIPVIVEALKEQDSIIAIQNTQIEALKKLIIKNSNLKSAVITDDLTAEVNNLSGETEPSLEQNAPNPFNQSTTIGYYLPASVKVAEIILYNMNGNQLKSVSINQKGKGSIIINGSELQPGMYIYTLIADCKEIDTKRMILTE